MLCLKENIIISTIDFNKKLMETLCDGDHDNEVESCLISGESLEERPIVLNCSHKFNYDSIFKEVRQQKVLNQLETTKLKTKEIKCPYCRKIQIGILPWKEGYEKVQYVNWPLKLCSKTNICNHIMKSGKKKGKCCGKPSHFDMCKSHIKLSEKQKEKEKNVKICCSIIKSGTRKGQCCGSKINNKIQECIDKNLCKTHLNSLHKIMKKKTVKNNTTKQTNTEAKTKTNAKVNAKVEPKVESKAKVNAKAETKANVNANVKAKAKVNAKVETKAKVNMKAETKVNAKVETKAKVKVDTKGNVKLNAKTKVKAKTKAKVDAKAKVKKKVNISQNKKLNPSKFLFSTMHISDDIFDC